MHQDQASINLFYDVISTTSFQFCHATYLSAFLSEVSQVVQDESYLKSSSMSGISSFSVECALRAFSIRYF